MEASQIIGKKASRAAPIPSKGEAVSIAAAIVKNRPNPKIYRINITSPLKEKRGVEPAIGRNISAVTAAHKETIGPILNIKVVLLLYTDPFLKSLIKV